MVNADSMQVYDGLRILTARPGREEEARVPHALYGHVDPARRYSVAQWREDLAALLQSLRTEGRPPVVVGGTGLYFMALTEGLAAVPPIDPAIRDAVAARAAEEPLAALHAALAARDPEGAARIRPTDRTRVLRALEVVEATGRPLAAWHAEAGAAPLVAPAEAFRLVLDPPRDLLYRRIGDRFAAMLEAGALGEVEAFLARGLDAELPAMKAVGLRELGLALAGGIGIEEAAARAAMETRRYAKRQGTWLRNRMADWPRLR